MIRLLLAISCLLSAGCAGMAGEDLEGTEDDAAASTGGASTEDRFAAWEDVPVMAEWERAECDQQRSARPSGSMPVPAPFDGSVADLLRSLEAGFDVTIASATLTERGQVVAYVPTPNGTDTFSIGRAAPLVEWRLGRVWPGLDPGSARTELNGTLLRLGFPPAPEVASSSGSEQHYSLQVRWPVNPDGLREANAEVLLLEEGPLSRGGIHFWANGGMWPAGVDNDTLEEAAQAFVDCHVGPGYRLAYGSPLPGWAYGSVARWMEFVLPTPGHHCGGPRHVVGIDIATKVVLGHADGQPCI